VLFVIKAGRHTFMDILEKTGRRFDESVYNHLGGKENVGNVKGDKLFLQPRPTPGRFGPLTQMYQIPVHLLAPAAAGAAGWGSRTEPAHRPMKVLAIPYAFFTIGGVASLLTYDSIRAVVVFTASRVNDE